MSTKGAKVRYRPLGAVLEAYCKANSFVEIIRGPLGAGKTKASAFKIFKRICDQKVDANGLRRSRWAVIRNTYPDLTSTTIRDWKEVVPAGAGVLTMGHPPEHKLSFMLGDGTRVEAEVLFIALDRVDDVKKLRGAQLTGAWINELKELPKAVFDMVTGRVDRYPAPGASSWVGVIGDTNAWDQDHWLQDLDVKWQAGLLEDYQFFTQPPGVIKVNGEWRVNPAAENLMVLRDDYYRRIMQGKKEDWIRVNLANEIGLCFDGRPVYPDYSDSIHGARHLLIPVKDRIVEVGLDFGLTPAAAFLQRQADATWLAFDELVTGHEDGDVHGTVGVERFALELKRKCAEYPDLQFRFRGDPAGNQADKSEQTYFQALAANGIVCLPASSNDPTKRRAAMERPLQRLVIGKPGIVFSPKCKVWRKGLAGAFNYKRVLISGAERYRDEPDKNAFSHICEAGEYGMMDAGENAVVNGSSRAAVNFPTRPVQPKVTWNPFDS